MGQEHKEYTWSLIAKKLTGEATPAELKELEDLLRYNPDLHYPVQTVTDLWNPANIHDQQIAEEAFNKHLDRMRELNVDFHPLPDFESLSGSNPGTLTGSSPIADITPSSGSTSAPASNAPATPMSQDMMATVTATGSSAAIPAQTPRDTDPSHSQMMGQIVPLYPHAAPKSLPARKLAYAAAVFCVVAAITLLVRYATRPADAATPLATVANTPVLDGKEIFTSVGSRTHMSLPDGTKIWLNAGSKISYDKNFGESQREVRLTGEAFFDVAPNANKPFVIHTALLNIRVLGTSFNVKSYPSDKTTEATLIRGSIEVSILNRPSDKIVLKPNEKLVVSNEDSTAHADSTGSMAARHEASTGNESMVVISKPTYEHHSGAIIETSWVDDKLIFQDETFAELARMMQRWYGVDIRFSNPALMDLRFTGIFEKETVRQALDALKLTAEFTYNIDGKEITIQN